VARFTVLAILVLLPLLSGCSQTDRNAPQTDSNGNKFLRAFDAEFSFDWNGKHAVVKRSIIEFEPKIRVGTQKGPSHEYVPYVTLDENTVAVVDLYPPVGPYGLAKNQLVQDIYQTGEDAAGNKVCTHLLSKVWTQQDLRPSVEITPRAGRPAINMRGVLNPTNPPAPTWGQCDAMIRAGKSRTTITNLLAQ